MRNLGCCLQVTALILRNREAAEVAPEVGPEPEGVVAPAAEVVDPEEDLAGLEERVVPVVQVVARVEPGELVGPAQVVARAEREPEQPEAVRAVGAERPREARPDTEITTTTQTASREAFCRSYPIP
jgi:hypothetical protein